MRVLVTGCGGYIGTTLTPYLLHEGYSVRCVDWLVFGRDVLGHVLGEKGFELVEMDVRSLDPSVFRGVDAVVDMAAIPNDPAGELNPELTMGINYRARARTARLAKEHGVTRYLLTSSASVYGRQSGVVDETATPNPLTTYARANLLAEEAVRPLAGRDYTVVVLRLSTVYGPSKRMRFDLVVNAMTLAAYRDKVIWVDGDGLQERPLVHVVDVARAVKFFLEAPSDEVNGEVFNIGSEDQNYKIIEIARIVQSIVGGEIRFRGSPDKRSYRLSFAKARKLGYEPMYRVPDGVKQLYHELLLGNIDPNDERWITVKWYKRLLEEGRVK